MRRYNDADGAGEEETNVVPRKSEAEILTDLKNKFEEKRRKKLEDHGEHVGHDESKTAEHDTSKAELKPSKEAKGVKKLKKRKQKARSGEDESGQSSGFTVLGENVDQSKRKVRRVLPQWLANPDIVSVDFTEDQLPVEKLEGLDEVTVARLKSNGVKKFFPVQRQVIPHLLTPANSKASFRPSDVCVSAPTGSGKTLAFVLPIVQALRDRVVTRVRALVILPVQDLATQVYRVFQSFASGTVLKVKLLTPQKSFAQEQNELVRTGIVGDVHCLADVIVATPGRLVDHIQNTKGFSLEHLRYLVIDEADRVMEDIQNDWLTHVESAVYTGGRSKPGPLTVENVSKGELPLQKLLFSATLSQNPEQLEQLNLFEPKLYTSIVKPRNILERPSSMLSSDNAEEGFDFIGQYTTPAELREFVVTCSSSLKKPQILHHLLTSKEMRKVLVFTNSLEHTSFLSILLKEYGLSVGELSSQVRLLQFFFKFFSYCFFSWYASQICFSLLISDWRQAKEDVEQVQLGNGRHSSVLRRSRSGHRHRTDRLRHLLRQSGLRQDVHPPRWANGESRASRDSNNVGQSEVKGREDVQGAHEGGGQRGIFELNAGGRGRSRFCSLRLGGQESERSDWGRKRGQVSEKERREEK